LRRAAGGGDAGFDIERVEPAGFFQRVQAVIADALEEGGVGIEQAIEPVDQDAGRQQIEQRLVAPPLAARGRLRRRQPVRCRRLRLGSPLGLDDGSRLSRVSDGRFNDGAVGVVPLSLSSRADNWRASFVEGAVFHRRQRRRPRIAGVRNGRTLPGASAPGASASVSAGSCTGGGGGVSTVVSGSVSGGGGSDAAG